MNCEEDNVEKKAVHFWSRISEVGQKAFEEALKVFNPVSNDPLDTETQLVAFLQGLREEGYQPTVLKSKDVYGYSSCTAKSPSPMSRVQRSISETATKSFSSKAPSKNSTGVKISNSAAKALASNSNSTSKVATGRLPITRSPNFLLSSLKHKTTSPTKTLPGKITPNFHLGVQPTMKLSVVLEALVPLTVSRLQKSSSLSIPKSSLLLISKASRMLGQSSAGKTTKVPSTHLPPKSCSGSVVKKASGSGKITVRPVNGTVVRGPNGRVLKESNASKASGVLNGRLSNGRSQYCNKGKAMKDASGKMIKKLSSKPPAVVGQKRTRAEDGEETPMRKKAKNSHLVERKVEEKTQLHKNTLNLLKSRAIKISKWSSDDEVRRKAQEILRVNLSPVIRIRPVNLSPVIRLRPLLSCPRP